MKIFPNKPKKKKLNHLQTLLLSPPNSTTITFKTKFEKENKKKTT